MAENEALVAEILRGDNRGLQLLAASGLVPLSPLDLISVQVKLSEAADDEIAAAATAAIGDLEPKFVSDLVAETEDMEVLDYLGRHLEERSVLAAIIHRRDVPPPLLTLLGERVGEELQELLTLRQDAIVENPEILDALERNPALGRFAERKIQEYREHLLPRERAPRKTREELEEEVESISDEELVEAINEVRKVPPEGDQDETTGLSESQIRTLAVPIRMKLARGAPKQLRNLLIRDPNPLVATAVLHHNALGDPEIEAIARNRAVIQEVLEAIGNHRSWTRKYSVVVALVKNPRVPVGIAMRHLPRLSVRDLQGLTRDRNVADAIRSGAKRLYKMKRG